jgi:hypothetical protein
MFPMLEFTKRGPLSIFMKIKLKNNKKWQISI